MFAVSYGRWPSPGPPTRVNRAPRADFIASLKSSETCQTDWRRGADSNPRDPSGFEGRNSTRVWRTIRPEQKDPRRRLSESAVACFPALQVRQADARIVVMPNIRRELRVQIFPCAMRKIDGPGPIRGQFPSAGAPRVAQASHHARVAARLPAVAFDSRRASAKCTRAGAGISLYTRPDA